MYSPSSTSVVVASLPSLSNTFRLAEALKGLMATYDIPETNVTTVTTDTSANQKRAIMQHTNMQRLRFMLHVLELAMGVLMRAYEPVRNTPIFRSFYKNRLCAYIFVN